jgi:hypothetical protein
MSATFSSDILNQIGTSGETPLHLRVLALGADRSDEGGEAVFAEGELAMLLRHPGEHEQRAAPSVDKAIAKAIMSGYVSERSTLNKIVLPLFRVRSANAWSVTA